MDSDTNGSETRQLEDYGGSDEKQGGAQGNQGDQGGDNGDHDDSGKFGEFGHTGVGTDLTVEMENTDVRTGMVKGGEKGADDAAGPGQYGGEAGGIGGK
ncbi:MAG TPA: hypothetical protein VJ183_09290 [Chloroflexia bacterium]|nr:hypothetical protein [Chloroflexia bacterium]